jgi:hypothetical protein
MVSFLCCKIYIIFVKMTTYPTGEQCFAVRAYRTAKTSNRTAKALLCVHARQHRHDKARLGNEDFAVRLANTGTAKPGSVSNGIIFML